MKKIIGVMSIIFCSFIIFMGVGYAGWVDKVSLTSKLSFASFDFMFLNSKTEQYEVIDDKNIKVNNIDIIKLLYGEKVTIPYCIEAPTCLENQLDSILAEQKEKVIEVECNSVSTPIYYYVNGEKEVLITEENTAVLPKQFIVEAKNTLESRENNIFYGTLILQVKESLKENTIRLQDINYQKEVENLIKSDGEMQGKIRIEEEYELLVPILLEQPVEGKEASEKE